MSLASGKCKYCFKIFSGASWFELEQAAVNSQIRGTGSNHIVLYINIFQYSTLIKSKSTNLQIWEHMSQGNWEGANQLSRLDAGSLGILNRWVWHPIVHNSYLTVSLVETYLLYDQRDCPVCRLHLYSWRTMSHQSQLSTCRDTSSRTEFIRHSGITCGVLQGTFHCWPPGLGQFLCTSCRSYCR